MKVITHWQHCLHRSSWAQLIILITNITDHSYIWPQSSVQTEDHKTSTKQIIHHQHCVWRERVRPERGRARLTQRKQAEDKLTMKLWTQKKKKSISSTLNKDRIHCCKRVKTGWSWVTGVLSLTAVRMDTLIHSLINVGLKGDFAFFSLV